MKAKDFPKWLEIIEGIAMIATGLVKVVSLGYITPEWNLKIVIYKIKRRCELEATNEFD